MAVEKAGLSSSVNLEPTAPVAGSPAAQGQSTRRNPEGKSRRERPPAEEESPEPVDQDAPQTEAQDADPDEEPSQHQIDSLA